VNPSYFLIFDGLKLRGQLTLFKLWEKGFNPSCIMPSFKGALLVRLIIEGAIVIIVPLITPLMLNALSLLAPVFDPATRIAAPDDVVQVSVILISPSSMLLRWNETTGQVPV
jgi:hypothetical protein